LWKSIKKDGMASSMAEAKLADMKRAPEDRYGTTTFRLIDLVPVSCKMASMEDAMQFTLW
jgi:hypothetical protein